MSMQDVFEPLSRGKSRHTDTFTERFDDATIEKLNRGIDAVLQRGAPESWSRRDAAYAYLTNQFNGSRAGIILNNPTLCRKLGLLTEE